MYEVNFFWVKRDEISIKRQYFVNKKKGGITNKTVKTTNQIQMKLWRISPSITRSCAL